MTDKIPYPDEYLNGPKDAPTEVCPYCNETVPEGEVDLYKDHCSSCRPEREHAFNFKPNEMTIMDMPEMERALMICRVCRYRTMVKSESPCFECRVINERRR